MSKADKIATLEKAQDLILVPAITEYKNDRETATSLQRCHQGLTRQMRLDAIRQIKRGHLANWRNVLDILRLRTRTIRGEWQTNARKIDVSTEVAGALLHGTDNTIWDLHERTGCHVSLHVSGTSPDNSAPGSYVLLSGHETALEDAVAEIKRLTARTKSESGIGGVAGGRMSNSDTLGIPPGTNEKIWHASAEFEPPHIRIKGYALKKGYDEIPKPETWTPQTLETYVATITKAKMPPRHAYLMYGSALKATQTALRLLHHAFEEAGASRVLSLRALKLALCFIEKRYPSFRNHGRLLINKMSKDLRMDASVFNILLKGTAKVKDLNDFEALLKTMIRTGCEPNAETCIHFVEMIEDLAVKRHIIRLMHERNMFAEPEVIQLVAKELAVWDVRNEKQNWAGLLAFLRSQNAKYGKNWASQASMNRIMLELARMGDFASCLELWSVMTKSASTKPTNLTVTIVVANARIHGDLNVCLAIIKAALQRRLRLDENVYHELFKMAYRLRKPNMLGVVWRYACLAGNTSWNMRQHVSDLTWFYGESQRQTEQDESAAEAESTAEAKATPPSLPTFLDPDMAAGLRDVKRNRRGAAIAWRMNERYKGWHPVLPLHEALEAALEQDRIIYEWVNEAKQFYKDQEQNQAQAQEGQQATLRRTVPGYRIALTPPHWCRTGRDREMEMSITHLATPEQIRQGAGADQARRHAPDTSPSPSQT
ncbi:hypothetical protein CSOJ01_01845 [Colletotrichum sojae]|uniref:Pentatricopeptide repeat domain-containing protein n=1 Tax=Colletotrichum sojae TaxID=2175907 RepID=A0A8H6N3V1_9PEZI|nr:hypothetical protein CSOJ01_01845 [Colletotrichum sojae]